MRPTRVQVTSTQLLSPIIPVNYLQVSFGIGLYVSLSFDAATVNYTVFHTPDDTGPEGAQVASIARVGTTATATFLQPHRLQTNDMIIVFSSGSTNLDSQLYSAPGAPGGQPLPYLVTVTSPTVLTYTVANAGATADGGNAKINCFRMFPHASLAAQTARADGNYAFSVRGTMLRANTLSAGTLYLDVLQGLGR